MFDFRSSLWYQINCKIKMRKLLEKKNLSNINFLQEIPYIFNKKIN